MFVDGIECPLRASYDFSHEDILLCVLIVYYARLVKSNLRIYKIIQECFALMKTGPDIALVINFTY